MSTAAPADEKPEAPRSLLEKIGAALPVGLTALATAFAGMSTGALQQAMYWKSQAAQDQSCATNQWSYAGFKRDRALVMQIVRGSTLGALGLCRARLLLFQSAADETQCRRGRVRAETQNVRGPPGPGP